MLASSIAQLIVILLCWMREYKAAMSTVLFCFALGFDAHVRLDGLYSNRRPYISLDPLQKFDKISEHYCSLFSFTPQSYPKLVALSRCFPYCLFLLVNVLSQVSSELFRHINCFLDCLILSFLVLPNLFLFATSPYFLPALSCWLTVPLYMACSFKLMFLAPLVL